MIHLVFSLDTGLELSVLIPASTILPHCGIRDGHRKFQFVLMLHWICHIQKYPDYFCRQWCYFIKPCGANFWPRTTVKFIINIPHSMSWLHHHIDTAYTLLRSTVNIYLQPGPLPHPKLAYWYGTKVENHFSDLGFMLELRTLDFIFCRIRFSNNINPFGHDYRQLPVHLQIWYGQQNL